MNQLKKPVTLIMVDKDGEEIAVPWTLRLTQDQAKKIQQIAESMAAHGDESDV